ncbi:MAG: response regulator [Lachnospiraceae bacterium]
MYQIMFVDDDPLILRRLHQILDWENFHFTILPDSPDGISALKKLETHQPDVMICDINMPNMDGLSLAKKAREKYPSIHCIILTVNDSFGCAQQALNIGVDHYLLKPIIPAKIEELIQKIITQLEENREQDRYVSNLYSKALLSEKMIRDQFLNWVVSGRQPLSEEQLTEKFDFYRLPMHAKEFQIISVHINPMQEFILEKHNIEDLLRNVTKHIEDALCGYPNCVVFSDRFYNLNILIGIQPEKSSFSPNAYSICQSIRDSLLFNLNLPVTLFYSRSYMGYQNIYRCYYDTKFLSKFTESVIEKGIISYEEYMQTSKNPTIDLDSIRSQLLKLLRTDALPALIGYVQKIFSDYSPANMNPENFNMLKIDFIMTGMMFLHETKVSLTDVFGKYFDPLSEITECMQPAECTRFILDFYTKILTFLRSGKISSGRRLAERTMELIEQNISNPELNVKWLAAQLYVNDNYLSRQFHKEIHIPLIQYMISKKLETAKNYLDSGYQNLQQVAQMAGFSDPLYFSKCFKKRFGVSPSKYK